MDRTLLLGCLMVVSSTALARPLPQLEAIDPASIDRIRAESVVALDANLQPVGERRILGNSRSVPGTWRIGFDTMATQVSNPAASFPPYSGVYGSLNGPYRFLISDPGYRNYAWLDDMDLPKIARGYPVDMARRPIRFIRFGFRWNIPGPLNMAARIYGVNGFSSDPFGPAFRSSLATGAIMVTRANLTAGLQPNKEISINLSSGGQVLMLPNDLGGIVVEIGTYDSATLAFQPLPPIYEVSPTIAEMGSPIDPVPSRGNGTNPSRSTADLWQDDSTPGFAGQWAPNYVFDDLTSSSNDVTEIYSLDYTGQNDEFGNSLGWLQPTIALLERSDAKVITGAVRFTDLTTPLTSAPRVATFEVRNLAGAILSTQTVAFGPGSGTPTRFPFLLADPNTSAGGTYQVYLRTGTWLGKLSSPISTTPTGLNFSVGNIDLVNGNSANSDNEVGPLDFTVVLSSFGSESGAPSYVANADLNKDNEVGPSDFSIVLSNFGQEGD